MSEPWVSYLGELAWSTVVCMVNFLSALCLACWNAGEMSRYRDDETVSTPGVCPVCCSPADECFLPRMAA